MNLCGPNFKRPVYELIGFIFLLKFNTTNVFSVDNRRLYVFRVLNLLGLLPSISVNKAHPNFEREITTENDGCHVRVRNRKDNNGRWLRVETYRHCSCREGRRKKFPGIKDG